MCNFFSFVTNPDKQGGKRYYFDWAYRKKNLINENDSHSTICKFYGLNEDVCNKYEYSPLAKKLVVDQINSSVDDRSSVDEWVKNLDFKRIVEPLIIKDIVNPLTITSVQSISSYELDLLRSWASVRASVRASVMDSVWDSVRDSVWAYISSFFDISYAYDFTPCVKLYELGLVPSFDGKTWRLHSGPKAKIVFEISKEELMK